MREVKVLNPFDLPSRVRATLAVMKSARAKNELMNIWESDILAIEDALAEISEPDVGDVPDAETQHRGAPKV